MHTVLLYEILPFVELRGKIYHRDASLRFNISVVVHPTIYHISCRISLFTYSREPTRNAGAGTTDAGLRQIRKRLVVTIASLLCLGQGSQNRRNLTTLHASCYPQTEGKKNRRGLTTNACLSSSGRSSARRLDTSALKAV